jgi:hypothetical protein
MDIMARSNGRHVEITGKNSGITTTFENLNEYSSLINWNTIFDKAYKVDISSGAAADAEFQSKGTTTMTKAAPAVVTLNSHGVVTGDYVKFTTDGALYTGLTAGTFYYVIKIDANTFYVCPTYADAMAGTNKIETTGTQSGTHTLWTPHTGARRLWIWGLDDNFNPIQEEIGLNGQTAVTTTKAYRRIFGMEVSLCGTGTVNAGIIYAVKTATSTWTAGVPQTVTSGCAWIPLGMGTAMNGMYTVPAGKVATLKSMTVQGGAVAIQYGVFSQKLADITENCLHKDLDFTVPVNTPIQLLWNQEEKTIHEWPEKTDILIRALGASAAIAVATMYLEVNPK